MRYCTICDYPMTHDDGFGWLHDDAPDGSSFDHMATDQDPRVVRIIRDYLVTAPEQGDWPWEDHCEGLASGILAALFAKDFIIIEGSPVTNDELRAAILGRSTDVGPDSPPPGAPVSEGNDLPVTQNPTPTIPHRQEG